MIRPNAKRVLGVLPTSVPIKFEQPKKYKTNENIAINTKKVQKIQPKTQFVQPPTSTSTSIPKRQNDFVYNVGSRIVHRVVQGTLNFAIANKKIDELVQKHTTQSNSLLRNVPIPTTLQSAILPNVLYPEFFEQDSKAELSFVFRNIVDTISSIGVSLTNEYVASVVSSDSNSKRIHTVAQSSRILVGKLLLDLVVFSEKSWKILSENEKQRAVRELKREYPQIDWETKSNTEIVEFLYQVYKKNGQDARAFQLLQNSNTISEEVERELHDTFSTMMRGIFFVPKRKQCLQFGNNVNTDVIVIALDSVLPFTDSESAIPMSTTLDFKTNSQSDNPEQWVQVKNIGVRIGPIEQEFSNIFFQYFTPIPIELVHNYYIDTHEYGLFKNENTDSLEIGRVVNMYFHHPTNKIFALVGFKNENDYQLLEVINDNYRPISTTMLRKRDNLNSFGTILQKNKKRKNVLQIFDKYKRVFFNS